MSWFKWNWFIRPDSRFISVFWSMNPQIIFMCVIVSHRNDWNSIGERMRNFRYVKPRNGRFNLTTQAFTLLSHLISLSSSSSSWPAVQSTMWMYPRRRKARCCEETMEMRVNNGNGSQVISIQVWDSTAASSSFHKFWVSLSLAQEKTCFTNIATVCRSLDT